MTSNPDLSIIILSWNTETLLRKCLNSIISNLPRGKAGVQNSNLQIELIVVDNASTDGSRKWLKQLENYLKQNSTSHSEFISESQTSRDILNPAILKQVQDDKLKFEVIFNDENVGFAKGNNQAIKKAKGDYILLLNSDTIILDQAIKKTLEFMKLNKNTDIAGCKLLNENKTIQPSVGKFPNIFYVFKMLFLDKLLKQTGSAWSMTSPNEIKEVDWITGAFMMVKKEVFDQIGGLDENIFMYFEEVEWCYRANHANKQVFFYPNAKITHLGGGSSPTGKTGPILHIYQGLVYFYHKHKPKWQEILVRLMLKAKAAGTYLLGLIFNNSYLKKTYGQAFKLV